MFPLNEYISRSRPKKRWMDCVKDNMSINEVRMEMTSDKREWKNNDYSKHTHTHR
jgi:hypothetical protein